MKTSSYSWLVMQILKFNNCICHVIYRVNLDYFTLYCNYFHLSCIYVLHKLHHKLTYMYLQLQLMHNITTHNRDTLKTISCLFLVKSVCKSTRRKKKLLKWNKMKWKFISKATSTKLKGVLHKYLCADQRQYGGLLLTTIWRKLTSRSRVACFQTCFHKKNQKKNILCVSFQAK